MYIYKWTHVKTCLICTGTPVNPFLICNLGSLQNMQTDVSHMHQWMLYFSFSIIHLFLRHARKSPGLQVGLAMSSSCICPETSLPDL